MGFFRVIATSDMEEFATFSPCPNIESARRVARDSGYDHAIIVDDEDQVIEVAV